MRLTRICEDGNAAVRLIRFGARRAVIYSVMDKVLGKFGMIMDGWEIGKAYGDVGG